jgi:hypothetical protein
MGYDLAASLSGASSATSGAQVTHGNSSYSRGMTLPPYMLPLALVLVFVVAIVFVIRK